MIASLLASLALVAIEAPQPAPGAGQCTSAAALGAFAKEADVPVGAWAEYAALVDGKVKLEFALRAFLVDTGRPGAPERWLELWADKRGKVAYRVPLDGQQEGAMLMKQGRAVFVMPKGAEAGASACLPAKPDGRLGETVVETLAGRIAARYYKKVSGKDTFEFWISEQVPPLDLVKVLYPNGAGMVLVAKGVAAASAFPERFSPAPLPTLEALKRLLPRDLPKVTEPPKPAEAAAPAPTSAE